MNTFYKKVFLVLLVFLTTLGIAKSQKNNKENYSIKIINTSGSIFEGEFVTDILKYKNEIKVVYSFRDSIGRAYYTDQKYIKLTKFLKVSDTNFAVQDTATIEKLNSFAIEAHKELNLLKKQYSYYSKDSLSLKPLKYISFTNLMQEILAASKEELENKVLSQKRAILDGSYYSFIIKSNSGNKRVYADSPDPITHPLLSKLIEETLNIYRKEKQNNFLDKMRTLSY